MLYSCYIHYKERAQFVNMICVTLVCIQGRKLLCYWPVECLGLSKGLNFWSFHRKYTCDKCQILQDCITHWALSVHATFSNSEIWRSLECQTIVPENLMFFSDGRIDKIDELDRIINYVKQIMVIIIINPLTARVVGAPQIILQPVFSIFPCSPLPSGTCRTPGLSIAWCCLPTSSSVCLAFFSLSLCLARWIRLDLMNGKHDHTTAVCVSLRSSGRLRVVQLPAGSWHGLPRW